MTGGRPLIKIHGAPHPAYDRFWRQIAEAFLEPDMLLIDSQGLSWARFHRRGHKRCTLRLRYRDIRLMAASATLSGGVLRPDANPMVTQMLEYVGFTVR